MKRFRSPEMREAYAAAGARERYAMENGNKSVVYVNGKRYLRFTYSRRDEYQDANGATYCPSDKKWVS